MDISVKNVNHLIKLSGTTNAPFFCGKDVCAVLEYKDIKTMLQRHVDQKDKRTLSDLIEDGATLGTPNQKLSYNDGKAIFLSEQGLFSLLKNSESPVAPEALKVISAALKDLKVEWLANEPMQDIFSFIVNHHQDLVTDMKAPWFQQWVQLSMVQFGFNHHGTTMDSVNHVVDENEVEDANAPESDEKGTTLWLDGEMQGRQMASLDLDLVVTEDLLDFLGYDGTQKVKQDNFLKLLTRNDIPFKLLTFEEGKDNKVIEREAERITPNNLKRKRWIMMTVESFKDAVMCLDTQRGREVRKYYRTIESLLAHYGSYQRSLLEAQRVVSTKRLTGAMNQLALKDKSEAELQEQLEHERQYTLRLKEMLVSDEKLEPTQVIYIATSKNYAAQNRFKVGGVESFDKLKSRLSQYNSRSAQGDDFYFSDTFMVLDYKHIESRLKLLVGRFRDKVSKEIYVMHYTNLQYIVESLCDRFNDDVDDVNQRLSQFIENLNVYNLRPVIPPPKEIKMVSTTLVSLGASGGVDVKTKITNDEDFCAAVESLIMSLPEGTTAIVKKEILDQLHVKTERKKKEAVILEVMTRLRPDLHLIRRNTK